MLTRALQLTQMALVRLMSAVLILHVQETGDLANLVCLCEKLDYYNLYLQTNYCILHLLEIWHLYGHFCQLTKIIFKKS